VTKSINKRQAVSTLTTIILILIITLTIAPTVVSAAAPDVTVSKIYYDYTENINMTVDPAITVTDGDTNVTGAKVSIGDGYVSSEDILVLSQPYNVSKYAINTHYNLTL